MAHTFTPFFGGAFFGGDFFSTTPNIGGGRTDGGDSANVYLRGKRRTSTDILMDRRRFGLDENLNETLTRWGRPKKKD